MVLVKELLRESEPYKTRAMRATGTHLVTRRDVPRKRFWLLDAHSGSYQSLGAAFEYQRAALCTLHSIAMLCPKVMLYAGESTATQPLQVTGTWTLRQQGSHITHLLDGTCRCLETLRLVPLGNSIERCSLLARPLTSAVSICQGWSASGPRAQVTLMQGSVGLRQ